MRRARWGFLESGLQNPDLDDFLRDRQWLGPEVIRWIGIEVLVFNRGLLHKPQRGPASDARRSALPDHIQVTKECGQPGDEVVGQCFRNAAMVEFELVEESVSNVAGERLCVE